MNLLFLLGFLVVSNIQVRCEETTESGSYEPEIIPHLCENSTLDAAFTSHDKISYFFQGDYYWEWDFSESSEGSRKTKLKGPFKIEVKWKTVTGPLSAAFSTKRWGRYRTYLIGQERYWRFTGSTRQAELFPDFCLFMGKDFRFENIPPDVDAAFVWRGSGYIYFFKGDTFWRYDAESSTIVGEEGQVSALGVPEAVDAVLNHPNGYTYFFKGDEYWKFSVKDFKVKKSYFPYPKKTHVGFFLCHDEEVAPGFNHFLYAEVHHPHSYWGQTFISSSSLSLIDLYLLFICLCYNLKGLLRSSVVHSSSIYKHV